MEIKESYFVNNNYDVEGFDVSLSNGNVDIGAGSIDGIAVGESSVALVDGFQSAYIYVDGDSFVIQEGEPNDDDVVVQKVFTSETVDGETTRIQIIVNSEYDNSGIRIKKEVE